MRVTKLLVTPRASSKAKPCESMGHQTYFIQGLHKDKYDVLVTPELHTRPVSVGLTLLYEVVGLFPFSFSFSLGQH